MWEEFWLLRFTMKNDVLQTFTFSKALWQISVRCPRRPASHHQAEAMGFVRCPGGEVRVVQRGGAVLQQLPAAHAGPGAGAESHGRPVPLAPVAHLLDGLPDRAVSSADPFRR